MGRSYVTFADLMTATRDVVADAPAWLVGAVVALTVAGLFLAAILLRRWGRINTASKVTTFATILGLGWSAQGMWDTAVHRYDQPVGVASMLFIVFEAYLIGRMLRAHEYRLDRRRRTRFVRAVWIGALVMAFVVAAGEGWGQAPARLAVPLLVAYGWYTDLTAEDDPAERAETSLRWTPREIGLRIGFLKVTDADVLDATAAERRQLTMRMARLAFAEHFGAPWISAVLRRPIRLARLRLLADQDQIDEVDQRLARARGEEVHPTMPPQPVEPVQVPTPEPTPEVEPAAEPPASPPSEPRPQRGTIRQVRGRVLVGDALREDFIAELLATVTPDRRRGASTEDICNRYDPPIKKRTAEKWAAEARRRLDTRQANGRAPHLTSVP